MKQIIKALLEAQKEMGMAKKDSKNPFFKSSYADLNSIMEACMPALNKHGIVVMQPIVQVEGKSFVKTLLLHESGETMDSTIEIIYSKGNDAQAQGSGITYARRYGMQSFLNIGAEDDDGNKASTPNDTKPPILPKKPLLSLPSNGDLFEKAKKFIQEGGHIDDVKKKYTITKEVETLLNSK